MSILLVCQSLETVVNSGNTAEKNQQKRPHLRSMDDVDVNFSSYPTVGSCTNKKLFVIRQRKVDTNVFVCELHHK